MEFGPPKSKRFKGTMGSQTSMLKYFQKSPKKGNSETAAKSQVADDTSRKEQKGANHSAKFINKSKKTPTTTSTSSYTRTRYNRGAFDTQDYRSGYPGKADNLRLKDNLLFYQNAIRSSPNGAFIDQIHKQWYGNYELLESHHGYIQWLFPIRESGMNWQAQELQLHEAKAIKADPKCQARVLKSYRLMLDFYGMRMPDSDTGWLDRAHNWKSRFQNLNRSRHNYLRITRILKSLGELGFEHLKAPFVEFVIVEALDKQTLPNCAESCMDYWGLTIKNDDERKRLKLLADQLSPNSHL